MYTTKTNKTARNIFPQDLDRVLGEIFDLGYKNGENQKKSQYTRPKANVMETTDKFILDLGVPGLNKADISIRMEKNALIISADVAENETPKYHLNEFRFGKFERTFILPEIVDKTGINAQMENGILSIYIPKKKEAIDNGPKEINII